jgi:hypothetical protein
MSMQGWVEAIGWASGDGPALSNTVTPTSILLPQGKAVLPANFFDKPGKTLRLIAAGRVSTLVTTPGTLTLDVRMGSSIVAFNGGPMALNVAAQTNDAWWLEMLLTCRSVGNGVLTTLIGTGIFTSRALIGSPASGAGHPPSAMLPDTSPVVGSGFDSTTTQTVDLFATWSIANAANSIQVHHCTLEALN